MVINWINNKASLSSLELDHWCEKIITLMEIFHRLDARHVYREHNQRADGLSKDSLWLAFGHCYFFEIYKDTIIMNGDLHLF